MIQAMLFVVILHVSINFVGWSLSGSQPAVSTSLSAGITASDTTIPVASVEGFPSAGWIYSQGEAVEYSAVSTGSCPSPFAAEPACFTGAARGGQETAAISHANGSRVFSEASGLVNDLSTFESRTSIDELGEVTTPWSSGPALIRFLQNAATWDWPMFEGNFAIFRVFGAAFTAVVIIGIFMGMAAILTSAVSLTRRIL